MFEVGGRGYSIHQMGSAPREPQSWISVLLAGPRTATEARRFLSDVLKEPSVETDAFAATLLISEVAGTAARYGQEPIELSIRAESGGVPGLGVRPWRGIRSQ